MVEIIEFQHLTRSFDDGIVTFGVKSDGFFREGLPKFSAVVALAEPPNSGTKTDTTQVRRMGKAEVEELVVDASETNEIEDDQSFEKTQKRRRDDEEEERLVIGVGQGDISDDGEDETRCSKGRVGRAKDGRVSVLSEGRNDGAGRNGRQVVFGAHQGIGSLREGPQGEHIEDQVEECCM